MQGSDPYLVLTCCGGNPATSASRIWYLSLTDSPAHVGHITCQGPEVDVATPGPVLTLIHLIGPGPGPDPHPQANTPDCSQPVPVPREVPRAGAVLVPTGCLLLVGCWDFPVGFASTLLIEAEIMAQLACQLGSSVHSLKLMPWLLG